MWKRAPKGRIARGYLCRPWNFSRQSRSPRHFIGSHFISLERLRLSTGARANLGGRSTAACKSQLQWLPPGAEPLLVGGYALASSNPYWAFPAGGVVTVSATCGASVLRLRIEALGRRGSCMARKITDPGRIAVVSGISLNGIHCESLFCFEPPCPAGRRFVARTGF